MLLISTTHQPATDLGFLLHKNPNRKHEKEFPFGKVVVGFPEANDSRCTVALMLEIDPVALVRKGPDQFRADQYVNDRPYSANSFLSSAITEFFRTTMSGRCKERPELAEKSIPIDIEIPVIQVRGGEDFIRQLFEPLGYQVEVEMLPLDEEFPEWGSSFYFCIKLSSIKRLKDVLEHLYVLIPTMDDDKHYWVGKEEVEKLLNRAKEWLPNHPAKEKIAIRYLAKQRTLVRDALARLIPEEDIEAEEEDTAFEPAIDEKVERKSLHQLRIEAAFEAIKESRAKSVVDLGCGEGKLLRLLLRNSQFQKIVGLDVCLRSLEKAKRNLRVEQMSDRQLERLQLLHGSITYYDANLENFDAAALVEVIEHLDLDRLNSVEKVVFQLSAPRTVVVTTPNKEYNALYETMDQSAMRHEDHRFEWTREEFRQWCEGIQSSYGYKFEISMIGEIDQAYGAPSQMAVFSR